jgi:predicted Zn-dependent protease
LIEVAASCLLFSTFFLRGLIVPPPNHQPRSNDFSDSANSSAIRDMESSPQLLPKFSTQEVECRRLLRSSVYLDFWAARKEVVMHRLISVFSVVLMPLVVVAAAYPAAQTDERLGSVTFPTSCVADVQKPFERAVSLLHSFVYEDAQPQFEDIFKKDSHCAIALWGEAMSIYYPLWFQPSANTIQRGRELIDRAHQVGAKTERERAYIDALATFYQGADTDYEARTAAYAHAMQNLAAHYPDDHEAAIFYALALLAATPPKDAPLSNRMRAAEILKPLYSALPNHPGVIHYLIHAYDTPSLAKLGLPMARRYAEVAPAAAHAVHMPAHIFTLLGFWQEDIDSNLAAAQVGQPSPRPMGNSHVLPLHFLDFLSYAYLQVGREEQTQKMVEQLVAGISELPGMMKNHALLLAAEIPARSTLDLRQWSRAASLNPLQGAPRGAQVTTYWVRAIGAARSGNSAQARESLHQFEELESPTGLSDPVEHARKLEASAWLAHSEGADDKAITELREADQLQQNADTTAHDWMGASAREMLADLLLELNRPSEALTEYQAALRLTPNRFDGLYGAARAAAKSGKPDDAAAYYAQIQKNCQGSTSDRPELAEAREFLRSQQASGSNHR